MKGRGSLDMVMKNLEPERAIKILAKSLYKELKKNGFSSSDIVNFSREIIECLADEVKIVNDVKVEAGKDRQLIG